MSWCLAVQDNPNVVNREANVICKACLCYPCQCVTGIKMKKKKPLDISVEEYEWACAINGDTEIYREEREKRDSNYKEAKRLEEMDDVKMGRLM